jgi:hypothetical protein
LKKNDFHRVLDSVSPGDLICCEWCDASIGKSSGSGAAIDVPVKSWGLFIGLFGEKTKHIVLAQNSFKYADGLFDLDYTAVPISWTVDLTILVKEHIPKDVAAKLVNSFLMGGRRSFSRRRSVMQRLRMHG